MSACSLTSSTTHRFASGLVNQDMDNKRIASSALISLLLTLIAACGGSGNAASPATPRSQAPAYKVISILEYISDGQGRLTIATVDGKVQSSYLTCNTRENGIGVTSDGYIRFRCYRDANFATSRIFEIDPSDWKKQPYAVTDTLIDFASILPTMSFGPNGEEFYSRLDGGRDTLVIVTSDSAGNRTAKDVLSGMSSSSIDKILYSDDGRFAYVLAGSIYRIDLVTKVGQLLFSSAQPIGDIAINGSDLVYTIVKSPIGNPSTDMAIVDIASGSIKQEYDFTCPNQPSFPGVNEYGGSVVVDAQSIYIRSATCYQIFSRKDYSISKRNYSISSSGLLLDELPLFVDSGLFWASSRNGSSGYVVFARDSLTWQQSASPPIVVDTFPVAVLLTH